MSKMIENYGGERVDGYHSEKPATPECRRCIELAEELAQLQRTCDRQDFVIRKIIQEVVKGV